MQLLTLKGGVVGLWSCDTKPHWFGDGCWVSHGVYLDDVGIVEVEPSRFSAWLVRNIGLFHLIGESDSLRVVQFITGQWSWNFFPKILSSLEWRWYNKKMQLSTQLSQQKLLSLSIYLKQQFPTTLSQQIFNINTSNNVKYVKSQRPPPIRQII